MNTNKQAWPDAVVTWGLRAGIVFFATVLLLTALFWIEIL